MSGVGDTYLPFGFSREALEAFSQGDHQPLIGELPGLPEYERVGVDRVLAIATDMALLGGLRAARVLDVGCSIGTIAALLARCGYDVTGIDSDVVAQVQSWQDAALLEQVRASNAEGTCTLVRTDVREHLAALEESYDVALLLSVVHHWLPGYGYTGVDQFTRAEVAATLEQLCRRTRRCIYLETPIEDEAEEMPPDPAGEFLFPGWFLAQGLATDVTLVASTLATNAKPRRLYRLDLGAANEPVTKGA
jgi:SAM-dependent methyltransferase